MITKFKLFENYDDYDLIEYVDYSIIEDFFDKHYHVDFDEALYMFPSYIWDNIDNERFIKDFERDYLDNQELEDIDEDSIKDYIKNNLTDDKKEKIREMYLEMNEGEDEDDLYDEDDYENMLDEFDDIDDIIEIATEDEDSYDIVHNIMSGIYDGYTAKELIEDFYGVDTEFYNKKQNSYNNTYDEDFKQLKKIVINYINKEGIEEDVKNGEDDENKKEFAEQYIEESPEMQRNIIANNSKKALEIFELIEDKTKNHIGDEYNFQKAYIQQYVEENPDDEDEDMITAQAIKNIYDTFKLHPDIEKEYPNDLILITTAKYNL